MADTEHALIDGLADGYERVLVHRDRAAVPADVQDGLPDDCYFLEAIARKQHPTLGPVTVWAPIYPALLDDPAYDLATEIRQALDEAVDATIAQEVA